MCFFFILNDSTYKLSNFPLNRHLENKSFSYLFSISRPGRIIKRRGSVYTVPGQTAFFQRKKAVYVIIWRRLVMRWKPLLKTIQLQQIYSRLIKVQWKFMDTHKRIRKPISQYKTRQNPGFRYRYSPSIEPVFLQLNLVMVVSQMIKSALGSTDILKQALIEVCTIYILYMISTFYSNQ